MGFKNNNRNQLDLLGYSLNGFVPMNAKCRFVVDLVKQLGLSDLYARYSTQGTGAYEPSAMLATWFYGYCEGVFTTRKLEEANVMSISCLSPLSYAPTTAALAVFAKTTST